MSNAETCPCADPWCPTRGRHQSIDVDDMKLKLRETWWLNGASAECIWCNRGASLCVITDPCADRVQYEEDLSA